MISLLLSFVVLIAGYLIYGRVVDRVFRPDNRATPAIAINDGVDCVPMRNWRVFLIQLLNIAGTGPIFGALMGAVFGPVVFLWIVLGSILGGAVHDYMSGMISCRNKGASIVELSGLYGGRGVRWAMRFFTLLLLIMVGAVFITTPAALLARLTPNVLNTSFWIVVIVIYYILATLLPINKIIGRLYPIFGIVLAIMAVGILAGILLSGDYTIPEITLRNLHPKDLSIWPFMFLTVTCGAISGFHGTQSPMMAKCIMSERLGRPIFFGAMICESIIALIWAAAGVAFYGATGGLSEALSAFGQSGVVYDISIALLGTVGGVLAIAGVVICPITSGDTVFRSARLILAEWTGLNQRRLRNRLVISIPLLAVGVILTQLDFNVLWRYFSWSNQTLAMITLWVATAYLIKEAKRPYYSLLTALPATFMAAMNMTYILMADEGFRLPSSTAYPIGLLFALGCFLAYAFASNRNRRNTRIKS